MITGRKIRWDNATETIIEAIPEASKTPDARISFALENELKLARSNKTLFRRPDASGGIFLPRPIRLARKFSLAKTRCFSRDFARPI